MDTGSLIGSLFLILGGLFFVLFNKKIYEWVRTLRKAYKYKSPFTEKVISMYSRVMTVIIGVAFIALGIYIMVIGS
jgi:hypothetical protein